jgi:hypothetical protein
MARPDDDLLALQEAVVHQRASALKREEVRLARQRAFLREERRSARNEGTAIDDESAQLEHLARDDWWPIAHLRGAGIPSERLKLRIGGQDFEVSKEVLCQDEKSLLFALCQDDSPALVAGDGGVSGTVVIDRDWWLFRFILNFLRDGLIPEDRATALQLYREASFWRLVSLQRAIEEAHLHLSRTEIRLEGGKFVGPASDEKSKFWRQKKNWWEAAPPKDKPKEKKQDWWVDSLVEKGASDVAKEHGAMLNTTWGYSRQRSR